MGHCRMVDIILMNMRRGFILLRGATGVAIVASTRLAVGTAVPTILLGAVG